MTEPITYHPLSLCIIDGTHLSILGSNLEKSSYIIPLLLIPNLYSRIINSSSQTLYPLNNECFSSIQLESETTPTIIEANSKLSPQTEGVAYLPEKREIEIDVRRKEFKLENIHVKNASAFLTADFLSIGYDQILLIPPDPKSSLEDILRETVLTDGRDAFCGTGVSLKWHESGKGATLTLGGVNQDVSDDPIHKPSRHSSSYASQLEKSLKQHHDEVTSNTYREHLCYELQKRSLIESRYALEEFQSGDQKPIMIKWTYCICAEGMLEMEISLKLASSDQRDLFLSCSSQNSHHVECHSGIMSKCASEFSPTVTFFLLCQLRSPLLQDSGIEIFLNAHWMDSNERRRGTVLGTLILSAEEWLLDHQSCKVVHLPPCVHDDSINENYILEYRRPRVLQLQDEDDLAGYCDILKNKVELDGNRLVIYGKTPEERASFMQLAMKYLPDTCQVQIPTHKEEVNAFLDGMLAETNALESGTYSVGRIVDLQCEVDEMASKILENANFSEMD